MFAPLKLAQKIQLGGEDKLRRIAKENQVVRALLP